MACLPCNQCVTQLWRFDAQANLGNSTFRSLSYTRNPYRSPRGNRWSNSHTPDYQVADLNERGRDGSGFVTRLDSPGALPGAQGVLSLTSPSTPVWEMVRRLALATQASVPPELLAQQDRGNECPIPR